MNVQYRPISAEELDDFYRAMGVPFGFDPTQETTASFKNITEVQRLRAALDGDQIVGTFGAFSLKLTVPGGCLSTAGTTVVTVLPTHRRLGILRKLMTEHLSEVYQNGEPLAALWASESNIYGRFGYGPASERAVMKLEKPFAVMQQPVRIDSMMRLVEVDEALTTFPQIFNKVAPNRPGMYERNENWWQHRFLNDPENSRQGATAHRRVIHIRDGAPVGYVLYRTKTDWAHGKNEVQVIELIGADAETEKSLWQYIFGIDLIGEITYWNQPIDDPLRWWLEQPRRMERKIEDAIWIRPVDVIAMLNGRRYSIAGTVVFRMHDELCPWNDGVYFLNVDDEGNGCCQASDSNVEIELTPFALGAAFLGGTRFRDLARSGLVTGTTKSLELLDAMFAWDPLPWCQELF